MVIETAVAVVAETAAEVAAEATAEVAAEATAVEGVSVSGAAELSETLSAIEKEIPQEVIGERVDAMLQDEAFRAEIQEATFPDFSEHCRYETTLPEDQLEDSRYLHDKYCNEQLHQAYENGNLDTEQFTDRQLEQIRNGDKPEGYTWHHHEEPGRMQLVDSKILQDEAFPAEILYENRLADLKEQGLIHDFSEHCRYETQLPKDLYLDSDYQQFKYCNEQLHQAYENGNLDTEQFTDRQLEQIRNGDKPEGYTWHHHEEPGRMQLVDSEVHRRTPHVGGRYLWGGGSEAR